MNPRVESLLSPRALRYAREVGARERGQRRGMGDGQQTTNVSDVSTSTSTATGGSVTETINVGAGQASTTPNPTTLALGGLAALLGLGALVFWGGGR